MENFHDMEISRVWKISRIWKAWYKTCRNSCINPGYGNFPVYGDFPGYGNYLGYGNYSGYGS